MRKTMIKIPAIGQCSALRIPRMARLLSTTPMIPQGEPIHALESPSTHPASSRSVNEEEIRRFAAVSSEWWNPSGPYTMLHKMNPVRISYVRQYVLQELSTHSSKNPALPFQGLNMLDIGSGGGFLSEALARMGGSVLGVDATLENIQIAQAHLSKDPFLNHNSKGSVEYLHSTAEQLVEQGHCFDVVLALEIIEHVNHPKDFIQMCSKLVKENGFLFVSTINRNLLSHFLTVSLAEDMFSWVPKGTHDSEKYIKPEELEMYFEEAGCEMLNVSGIGYNPLSSSWFLQKGTDVNYIAVAKKIHTL